MLPRFCWVTALSLTFNATSSQSAPRRTEISHGSSSVTSTVCKQKKKMADHVGDKVLMEITYI